MPTLTINGPRFFSHLDEKLFFDGLCSISGVEAVNGESTHLVVSLRRPLSAKAQADLNSLLKRYNTKIRPNGTR
jgi:hypothetical protein